LGDFDNDGDLDLVVVGMHDGDRLAKVYRNDGNWTWTDIVAGLTPVSNAAAAWGDADNDGDYDLAVIGNTLEGAAIGRVYLNAAGVFMASNSGLDGFSNGAISWGDFDNDGLADLALCGYSSLGPTTKIYRNAGNGTFVDAQVVLPGVFGGGVTWVDVERDGLLDLLIGGAGLDSLRTVVYRNMTGVPTDKAPSQPTNMRSSRLGDLVTFGWDPATDQETPPGGLSYQLRVGLSYAGGEVMDGARALDPSTLHAFATYKLPGSAQKRTSWTLRLPAGRVYYWDVQAIDAAGRISTWDGTVRLASETADVMDERIAEEYLRVRGNPITDKATFALGLASPTRVKVVVCDVQGRQVAVLCDGTLSSGVHAIVWVPDVRIRPGAYFAIARFGSRELSARVVLTR